MATWLAADQLDFHGAAAVASGWLRRARRLLDAARPGPDHGWLAFHEGYVAHAAGDTASGRASSRCAAAELGRRFDVADLEMLGLALEGATLVAARAVEEGMRCLDEATAAALEGEADDPDLQRLDVLLPRLRVHAVLDYERAYEWCDRIAEFAERYGSRYMLALLPRRVRRRPPLARPLGARPRRCWRRRSRTSRARARRGSAGPLAGLAELRRRQGRPTRRSGCSTRPGPCRGAALPRRLALDRGDARTRGGARSSGCCAATRRSAGSTAPGAGAAPPGARGARRPRRGAAAALAELREVAGGRDGAAARLRRPAPRACSPAARRPRARARAAGGRRRRVRAERRAVRGGPGAARARGRASTRSAAPSGGARGGAARARLLGAGRRARALPAPAGPAPRSTAARARGAGLLAEGLTNRQIAERLVVSEHTVHRHVTNILRKLDLPSRAAAAAHAVRGGLRCRIRPGEDGRSGRSRGRRAAVGSRS